MVFMCTIPIAVIGVVVPFVAAQNITALIMGMYRLPAFDSASVVVGMLIPSTHSSAGHGIA